MGEYDWFARSGLISSLKKEEQACGKSYNFRYADEQGEIASPGFNGRNSKGSTRKISQISQIFLRLFKKNFEIFNIFSISNFFAILASSKVLTSNLGYYVIS